MGNVYLQTFVSSQKSCIFVVLSVPLVAVLYKGWELAKTGSLFRKNSDCCSIVVQIEKKKFYNLADLQRNRPNILRFVVEKTVN
jgi:hypothetical protein